jgi:hypothetical protein
MVIECQSRSTVDRHLGACGDDGLFNHPLKRLLDLGLEVGLALVDIAELGEGPAAVGVPRWLTPGIQ